MNIVRTEKVLWDSNLSIVPGQMIKDHLSSRTVGGSGVMLQIHHIELIITTVERKSVTAGLLLTNTSFAK